MEDEMLVKVRSQKIFGRIPNDLMQFNVKE